MSAAVPATGEPTWLAPATETTVQSKGKAVFGHVAPERVGLRPSPGVAGQIGTNWRKRGG